MKSLQRLTEILLTSFLCTAPLWAQAPQPCVVELFIGDPEFSTGDGGPALDAKFFGLGSLAAADDGTVYVADGYRIRKIDPQGTITTIAGNGTRGTSGDGGPASQAQLGGPSYLTLAPDGSLYFSDDQGRLIRRIAVTGVIETVYSWQQFSVRGLAVATDGTVYFTEITGSSSVISDIVQGLYRLETNGSKTVIAGGLAVRGNGTASGVPALDYAFESIGQPLVASNGDLVVRDRDRLMRIGDDGIIRVVVGNGGGTFVDGALALETGLGFPNFLTETTNEDLFIGATPYGLIVVRDGFVHRLVSGNIGGLTSSAAGVHFTQEGRVFRLLQDDTVQPIAGIDRSVWYEPGRPLNQRSIDAPRKMLIDSQNRLYFFDASFATVVSRTTLDGKIEVIAGGGDQPADDGVPALDADIRAIGDIALDGEDRLYLSVGPSSARPSMILRVELNGTLTVLAGEGENSQPERFSGQNVSDTNFSARVPLIAVTPDGTLYFQVRSRSFMVDADGIMNSAPPGQVSFMAFDRQGRLLAADTKLQVYEDLAADPSEPFNGFITQGASTDNGTFFGLRSSLRVLRRTPDGRTTDLYAYGAGVEYVNGTLAPNRSLGEVSAIATNEVGDLFMADPALQRVFVVRNADECAMERPYVAAVLSGASFASNGRFAPGELVSVFGDYLGGENLARGAPGQSDQGTWQTSVGGLEVFVDDQPAPLVFSRSDQAAFVIPNEVQGRMLVRYRLNGLDSATLSYPVLNAFPGIFTANSSGGGQAAALNQDSSINSPSNPAAAGSVIVLYLTGAGLTNPPSVTGSLNGFPLPQLVEQVEVTINGVDAVVEFAGPAPGLISGVVQVNARIPADTPSGPVEVNVKIGGVFSPASPTGQPVTISIQ